jgi:hypothetical protein
VEAAARSQTQPAGPTYLRRQPEKTALYQVLQRHLLTFEQEWTDEASGFEIVCQKCQSPLRLIALIKNEDIAKRILTAMHLPAEVPQLHPARPPPQEAERGGDDRLTDRDPGGAALG